MKTLYIAFIFSLMLSACGRTKTGFDYQDFSWNGIFYDQKLVKNSDESRTLVSILPDSTIPFSPVSVDAKYGDCSGAILYHISIRGNSGSSIRIQSETMPALKHMYSRSKFTPPIPVNQPSVMPHFPSLLAITGGSDINFANGGTQTNIIFDIATDKRIAFRFTFSYGLGLVLGGTVDVPLTPGRQIVCN